MSDSEIERLRAELERVNKENNYMRAALAVSKDPCQYCKLPADEMAKCQLGFPGCARADDMAGCPELGARLEVEFMRVELDEIKAELADLRNETLEEAVKISKRTCPKDADFDGVWGEYEYGVYDTQEEISKDILALKATLKTMG